MRCDGTHVRCDGVGCGSVGGVLMSDMMCVRGLVVHVVMEPCNLALQLLLY